MNIIEHLAHCNGESIMIIRDMFKDDINRTINGVVQVEQEEQDVIKQELNASTAEIISFL